MSHTAIVINGLTILCLIFSLFFDRQKTRQAVTAALSTFVRILPQVLLIILLIGLLMGFISPAFISRSLGQQSGVIGIFIAAVIGTVTHIPSIISFPLAASLLQQGAMVTTIATFITTLTMIGLVTLPLAAGLLGKGARVSNIVIFLTAWACIKIPQELVELQFLGAKFMTARLGLTILAAIVMGSIIEYLINLRKIPVKNKTGANQCRSLI